MNHIISLYAQTTHLHAFKLVCQLPNYLRETILASPQTSKIVSHFLPTSQFLSIAKPCRICHSGSNDIFRIVNKAKMLLLVSSEEFVRYIVAIIFFVLFNVYHICTYASLKLKNSVFA